MSSPLGSNDRDVVVVVAAGPGLGLALAQRFAREGAAVGLVARAADGVDQLAAPLRDSGAVVATAAADVADEESLRAALAGLRVALGDPTVLVYNGSAYIEGSASTVAPHAVLTALRVGVVGAVVSLQEVVPAMRAAGRGTIVLTGSAAADRPSKSAAAVGMAKAALRSLALSAHAELAPDGVRALTVTINGVLRGPNALDVDEIADLYWRLHTSADAPTAEVRFPG